MFLQTFKCSLVVQLTDTDAVVFWIILRLVTNAGGESLYVPLLYTSTFPCRRSSD